MPGHDGQVRRTTQNRVVVQSRPEEGLLHITGAIPRSKGSVVIARPATKNTITAA